MYCEALDMDQKFLIPVSKTLDMDQKFLILAYKPSDISKVYRQGSEISYPYPRLHSTDRDQIPVCEALNMDQDFLVPVCTVKPWIWIRNF